MHKLDFEILQKCLIFQIKHLSGRIQRVLQLLDRVEGGRGLVRATTNLSSADHSLSTLDLLSNTRQ